MSAGEPVRRWRGQAMGGRAAITVVGGSDRQLRRAQARLEQLEARWSRFRADSELCQLARGEGRPMLVSSDTALLVARMRRGWQATGGRFDPTVGAAVIAAGYDRSFTDLGAVAEVGGSAPAPGLGDVQVDRATGLVQVPRGLLLDPGAIGKGLAADLVVAELRAAGVAGALVDLGGDLRVSGRGPRGGAWHLAVADALEPDRPPVLEVALADGAVATSGVTRRCWPTAAGSAHHLIDPRSGRPTTGATVAASVVAGAAWWAEVLATAALVAGGRAGAEVLTSHGVRGVVRCRDGRCWWSDAPVLAA